VASGCGLVVGFIRLYVAEGRLNIGWLGVARDRHRQGIRGQLLKAAEQHARRQGIGELATHTLDAGVDYPPYERTRAFYFKHGFEVYQTSRTDNPGCPEEIRIRKRVD
jgi:GNAT superfamily N-acetyltransferase